MSSEGEGSRITMITLGCAKNLVDSERVLGRLNQYGIEVHHDRPPSEGDVVVVNTCGFIRPAQEESIDTILHLAEARRKNKIRKLIVMGCLVERFRKVLASEIPEVDHWVGSNQLEAVVRQVLSTTTRDSWHHHITRYRLTPRHYAYLKIAEGCNRPCAFCAIPQMRGRFVSKPIDELVTEAQELIQHGVRELILIAQDTTYYGIDLYGKRKLADLLVQLADLPGLQWIRLHYAFPSGFPMEVIKVMRDHPNICNYLDIPLQHVATPILRRMRRGIDKSKTYELIHRIRDLHPEIAIRSTFMVGFPGETDEDFEQLLIFLETMKLDRVGVFTYSHEEGTLAYSFADDVPEAIKQQRANQLMELQRQISYEQQQRWVGQHLTVILDEPRGTVWGGRTEYDSPEVDNEVIVEGLSNGTVGQFASVKVTMADEYSLTATATEE